MTGLEKEYKLSAVFSQEQDCEDTHKDGYQFLSLSTTDCGGGSFYVLESRRWAFDDPKELIDLINEFVEKNEKISKSTSK